MNRRELETQRGPDTMHVLDARVDAVLAASCNAEPEDGLEQRVLQRLLSEESADGHSTWAQRYLRPRFVTLAALALGALCMVPVLLRHTTPASSSARLSQESAVRQVSARIPAAAHARPGDAVPASSTAHAGTAKRSATAKAAAVRPAILAKESARLLRVRRDDPSFPAPAMPMTEQEQLLLEIAHRHDPLQVAMLDPVERRLQIARERAESARFFAPPPLPHELQQEINTALRSQYVNTPPPRELLAQTTDRSTP